MWIRTKIDAFFSTYFLQYRNLYRTFIIHPISVERMNLLEHNTTDTRIPGIVRTDFGPQAHKKIPHFINVLRFKINRIHDRICYLGVTEKMDESARRRVFLLNQLNILHFITCLIIPFLTLTNNKDITAGSWIISLAPCFVSFIVVYINSIKRYHIALLAYFILYPFCTCLIYMSGMNLGMGLYFIMYGILAVFFLQEISYMIFFIAFTMISYFMLEVVLKDYTFKLAEVNPAFFYFNQAVAILFIFYGLYLIKRENAGYQSYILHKNEELNEANRNVQIKNQIISEKAAQLERQTARLSDINTFQTKLFSIISHDLRGPVYALRDLFKNAAQETLSLKELEELVPDVATDLSHTTELIENLLQWAKSQMQTNSVQAQELDMGILVKEVIQLLRLQAETKKIKVQADIQEDALSFSDRDMMQVVIRNLLSNAIKFTPQNGSVFVKVLREGTNLKVTVKDTGMGMSTETLRKINENKFFSMKGTANESGTGLGLMLCKEFLSKNKGRFNVESTEGEGSVFSFVLPAYEV